VNIVPEFNPDITEGETDQVLIIEESKSLARCYEAYLTKLDCTIRLARDSSTAVDILEQTVPNVILLDFNLANGGAGQVMKKLGTLDQPCAVILMVDRGGADAVAQAYRELVFDYIEKPFKRERLLMTVSSAREHCSLERSVYRPSVEIDQAHVEKTAESYYGFIGKSPAMQNVYQTIEAAAQSKATVFITGESGTGKEVCAQAIHLKSPRSQQAFVPINCAAIPKDLMESEIFGHVKGAFTGANGAREGAASRAHGGTLFLDEIGEMDLDLQSKMLRFIQTGTVQKVGGNKSEQVDVRFVCATNRDPLAQVREGAFREDLYYRLHVIPIGLPPLRERGDDVLLIAREFLKTFTEEEGKSFTGFTPEAEELFLKYPWPGNIRQLQNVVRNIVVLNEGREVSIPMLPPPLDQPFALGETIECTPIEVQDDTQQRLVRSEAQAANYSGRVTRKSADSAALTVIRKMLADKSNGVQNENDVRELWQVEMETIEQAIKACGNNIPQAAKRLGVSPSTIYRKRHQWKDQGYLNDL